MRLIDADALMPNAEYKGRYDVVTAYDIANAPTIELERKKGKWIWNVNGMDWGLGAWTCSECKSKPETWWENDRKINPLMCSGSSFCGNCGADMREGDA